VVVTPLYDVVVPVVPETPPSRPRDAGGQFDMWRRLHNILSRVTIGVKGTTRGRRGPLCEAGPGTARARLGSFVLDRSAAAVRGLL